MVMLRNPNYATKRDSNGPRHTVVMAISLGADCGPDADAKLINADEFEMTVCSSANWGLHSRALQPYRSEFQAVLRPTCLVGLTTTKMRVLQHRTHC